jgi:diguanylate cyclase (GGDEF)-like protein
MFKLLRYFSYCGLIGVLVAALMLGGLYRYLSVKSLVEMGEENNISLARSMANSLGPTLANYVAAAQAVHAKDLGNLPGLPALRSAIRAHMTQLPVVKVKAYDLSGRTIFSTEPQQIGEDKRANAGFQIARGGRAASELTHRDRFSAFEGIIEDLDVLSTYIPFHSPGGARPIAVFEIYSDVTPFLRKITHTQSVVSLSVLAVLLLLYAGLYGVVRRAERILKGQYAEHEAARKALVEVRDTLEQRVTERTAALEAEVQERKLAEARASFLAHHDKLTGLPNRALFMDRLHQAVARAARNGRSVAVLFLDLDRFKTINDSLGHATGDELLKVVGSLCAKDLRETDTVARLGGDEFIFCLGDVGSAEEAGGIARRILSDISGGIDIGGHVLHSNASIGISLYPMDGADAETLIRNADTAMYHAKEDGRGTFHFFRQHMTDRVKRRLALELGLREALERGEFVLHYQPIVQVDSGRVVGAEALLRWHHPERGLMSPSEFISVAEEIGLIVPLGKWVLNEACAQAAKWVDARGHRPFVCVNISARQFHDGNLTAIVESALARSGLPASRLELEITESVLMNQSERGIRKLREFETLGVRLAIDDFGTGYSSLAYLKRFPVSTIKIDRSFLHDVARDEDDRAIVTAVVAMARSLGLAVTAEGVERAEQIAFLRELGCDRAQGYLFGRPRAVLELEALLRMPGVSSVAPVAEPMA